MSNKSWHTTATCTYDLIEYLVITHMTLCMYLYHCYIRSSTHLVVHTFVNAHVKCDTFTCKALHIAVTTRLEVLYECSNAMRMAFICSSLAAWLFIVKAHTHNYECIHTMPCRFDAPSAQPLSSSSLHWQCSLSLDSGM